MNNQEFYCNHCRKHTLFFLESDRLWHCDECENVLGSIPRDKYSDDDEMYDFDLPIVRCPSCNNLVSLDEVVDGQYCPVCFEDLEEEFLKLNEEEEEDED